MMECEQYNSETSLCERCKDEPEFKYRCRVCNGRFCIMGISADIWFDERRGAVCYGCSDGWDRRHPPDDSSIGRPTSSHGGR